MTHSTSLPKVATLSSILLMLFFYLGAVFTVSRTGILGKISVDLFLPSPQCDAPSDTNPIVIGIAGSVFVAVYNVSGSICVFQEPSSHVSGGKVYLSGGDELKEVKLPTVDYGAVVSNSKGSHYIIFHKNTHGRSFVFPKATINEKAKEKAAGTLGDDDDDYPIYDIDKKDLVPGKVTISDSPISSTEQMTLYSVQLTSNYGWLTKHSYTGESVSVRRREGASCMKPKTETLFDDSVAGGHCEGWWRVPALRR